MTDQERAADYLKRSKDARREARCVMDPEVRAGFHRVGDEYERMSFVVLRNVRIKGTMIPVPATAESNKKLVVF